MKILICGSFFASASVASAASCENSWSVFSKKEGSFLNLTVREKGRQGPACDLVIKDLHYIDGLHVLSVTADPVKFCPVDAVTEREAQIRWQLPRELRGEGVLRFIVNGEVAGNVLLRIDNTVFDGACR